MFEPSLPLYLGSKHPLEKEFKFILITQGEDETAEEKGEGIEGILSDVLDDENVIKATLTQVKLTHFRAGNIWF